MIFLICFQQTSPIGWGCKKESKNGIDVGRQGHLVPGSDPFVIGFSQPEAH